MTHTAEASPVGLADVAEALRAGRHDLAAYLNALCDRIDATDPELQALLPEPDRRARLLAEAAALREEGQGSRAEGQGSGVQAVGP
jgi:Asp-tRNA(Asn)/Glu-tRNA(Gln) amidotransferase A subunit family amidase